MRLSVILAAVNSACNAHGCTIENLLADRRIPHFAAARQQAWAELHAAGLSINYLAKLFDRNRKTIRHGIQEHGNKAEAARLRARRCA